MRTIYQPRGRAREYSHLALNHYVGCGHGCKYCYAADMTGKFGSGAFSSPAPRAGVIEALKRDAVKYAGTDRRVLLSFMTDPYQPIDDELQLTRRVIEILKRHRIPMQVLTKGGMAAARDFDLYTDVDAFACTMTFIDKSRSVHWEPRAALPAERMAALMAARARGIETWVSLEPVIDADESLAIIDETHEYVDLYKIGKMNHCKSDIDWTRWARYALGRCRRYGKRYYIKNDLAGYLGGIKYANTDTRRVGN